MTGLQVQCSSTLLSTIATWSLDTIGTDPCGGHNRSACCLTRQCHVEIVGPCDTEGGHVRLCVLHEQSPDIWAACHAAEPILDIAAIGMNEGLTSSAVTTVNAADNGKQPSAAIPARLWSCQYRITCNGINIADIGQPVVKQSNTSNASRMPPMQEARHWILTWPMPSESWRWPQGMQMCSMTSLPSTLL